MFDIEMSTGSVFDDTLARAGALGLRVRVLEAHHDVDDAADLKRLVIGSGRVEAPRTRRWLEQNGPF